MALELTEVTEVLNVIVLFDGIVVGVVVFEKAIGI